jgi:hypothetical protein
MQLAMNASHAPRRYGSVACWDCSKQKSSISLGAAEAGVTLTNVSKVTATCTHFVFNIFGSSAVASSMSPMRHTPDMYSGDIVMRHC